MAAARLKLRLDAAWGAPGRGSPAAHWGPGEAERAGMLQKGASRA
jgi:hypothetical protein